MKKNFFRAILSAAAAMLLVLGTSITAFAAENAKSVENAAGRSVIVQSVLGVSGSTQVIRGEKTFQPAKGVRLLEGDTVRTSGDNKVYIAIDGSMILRIDTDSEAVITKATFGQKLTVTLKAGRMFYNVAKQSSQNETLELVTNYVTIAIRGTSGELSTGNGKVQSMLFDGVIEVTDGKQVVQQVPGQMLSTALAPGNQTFKGLTVNSFKLADIPKSLVEEMKNDADLKDRVLKNVPVSTDPQGNKVFLDKETFDKTIYGVEDDIVFRDSVIRMGGSAGGGTNGGSGYSGGSSSGGSSGGSSDPDPAPTKITCPGCSQEITSGAAGHALVTTCVCGTPIYECSSQSLKDAHAEVTYDCGEKGPACKAKDHENTPYACGDHSGPKCKASEHALAGTCDCGNHSYYACWNDTMKAVHTVEWSCPECGLDSYGCDPISDAVKADHQRVKCDECSALAGTEVTYCQLHEANADVKEHYAICSTEKGGCGEEYCPTAEKAKSTPEHHAICSLAEGGCGSVYCPKSTGASNHNSYGDLNCGHKGRLCVSTGSGLFNLHLNGTAYKCPNCDENIGSCNALAGHDIIFCSKCKDYHSKCCNCKTDSGLLGSGGSGHYDLEPLLKGETLDESVFESSEQKKEEQEEIPEELPEELPETPSETIPEAEPAAAVECVAVVSAETSEKKEE